jgi:hypothetical protein
MERLPEIVPHVMYMPSSYVVLVSTVAVVIFIAYKVLVSPITIRTS